MAFKWNRSAFVVVWVLCSYVEPNVTGFEYEMISSRLDSIEGLEHDLLQFTNATFHQLKTMEPLLKKFQLAPIQESDARSAGVVSHLVSLGTSCRDVPLKTSGIYKIDPNFPFQPPMTVYCSQEFDNGGWTVIQRRFDESVNFFQDWQAYKQGFGTLRGEFWLGLDNIHRLTNVAPHELLVTLEDFDGQKASAKYQRFRIGGESIKYMLMELGPWHPCGAGDAFGVHLNESFSTYDRDNSKAHFNCAIAFRGGWWFHKCHRSHLNGEYLRGKLREDQDSRGVMWNDFRGDKYSLKATQMMIRPIKSN